MTDLGEMSTDELIAVYRKACEADEPGLGQHAAVERINSIKREIGRRDGATEWYRALLADPSPHVRYSAALSVQWDDPDAAYEVFRRLVADSREVRMQSRMAMYQLEDSGRLKP